MSLHRRSFVSLALPLALAPFGASAQGSAPVFPSMPIKMIVPFTPGSGADSSARFYGEHLSRIFKQPVVVDNRPGASGIIAIQAVRQAPADGHTLFMGTNSP